MASNEPLRARLFHAEDGVQEFHTPDMARWLAGTDGAGEQVVQFLPSEEDGKEGLIVGYLYRGPEIVDGARAVKPGAPSQGASGRMTSPPSEQDIAVRSAPRKPRPPTLTPEQFKDIRQRLDLSTVEFARKLGYAGTDDSLNTQVRRFEAPNGRIVPPSIARLATMFLKEHVQQERRKA